MTPERAKELLPIIQAFAEGKQIQTRPNDEFSWQDVAQPCWDDKQQYRIKPEKKVGYAILRTHTNLLSMKVHKTEAEAQKELSMWQASEKCRVVKIEWEE